VSTQLTVPYTPAVFLCLCCCYTSCAFGGDQLAQLTPL
jgi:hypothetical protein